MRHHYIPCFYTKRWTGTDKRLCEYSRPHKSVKPRRAAPAGTGYEEDLYAIPRVTEDKKHLIETKFMKEIDQRASDILSKMEHMGVNALDAVDRIFWATFLISLVQRNPEKLKELSVNADIVQNDIMSKLEYSYLEQRSPRDPPTYNEFLQVSKDGGHLERNKALMLQDTILLPQAAHLMSGFHWGICLFDNSQHELLTSDRPIIMSNGLRHRDGHIGVPIGPRKLFVAARNSDVTKRIIMKPNFVKVTNDIIVRQAQRYVYGTTDTQLCFIETRLRSRNAAVN